MLRQVQSDRSNLAHGWLPFAADSIRQQFGTQMPQGGHPPHHSSTSSARASTVAGISRPSDLAVFRLITSSYLVAACTGRSAGFSPTTLHAQAFGEIAAEQMLPEMHELAVEIDPDLPAHVAPSTAEGIVLGQVSARIRIDHAIVEPPVQVRLRMVRGAVRHVVELRIVLHHHREHLALDHHETGRRFGDLDEALTIDISTDAARSVIDRIER